MPINFKGLARVSLIALSLIAASVCLAQQPPTAPPNLILEITKAERDYISEEFEFEIERFKGRADRVRAVKINLEALSSENESFLFNPFSGVNIQIRHTETDQISPPISVIWKGEVLDNLDKIEKLEEKFPEQAKIANRRQKININIIQNEISGSKKQSPFISKKTNDKDIDKSPRSHIKESQDLDRVGPDYYTAIVAKISPAFSKKTYRITPIEELPGYHLVSETDLKKEIKNPRSLTAEEAQYLEERKIKLKNLKEIRDKKIKDKDSKDK